MRSVPRYDERYASQMAEHLRELWVALDERRLAGFYIVSLESAKPGDRPAFMHRRAGISGGDASWGLISGLLSVHLERLPE